MGKKELTTKQLFIGSLLVDYYKKNEKGCNIYIFINTYKNELQEKGIDISKVNSANATLASLGAKDYVDKKGSETYDKDLDNKTVKGRTITIYKPTQKLIDLIEENN